MIRLLRKGEKGQALVEMAVVLPILLLLLFTIIEFGWIFGAQLLVTHASREGARYGSVHAEDSTIMTDIQNRSQAVSSILVGITVTPQYTNMGNKRQGDVIVNVSYAYSVITPVVSAITGNTVTVQASCQMKVE